MSTAPSTSELESKLSTPGLLASARDRDGVVNLLHHAREAYKEWIRRAVIKRRRVDILASLVLGYEVHPRVHHPIIRHQIKHPRSMTLAARGFGKTTVGTIAKVIHYIITNPNIRGIIGSKVADNAAAMLSEIKGHFENNEELIDIFGNFVGERQWDERSIEVRSRTVWTMAPTVSTVGVETAIASKHVDFGIADDLVDDKNSITEHQRDNIKRWFYKTFLPVILPPDPTVPGRGDLHILGTHYHPEDLYHHFKKSEFKGDKTLTIPSLDEHDESVYPERFTTEFLRQLREDAGIIIFNSQFQLDTEAMRGDVFDADDCDIRDTFPPNDSLAIGIGVDLAIGKKAVNDFFALTVLGKDQHDEFWVLDFLEKRLSFSEQQKTIADYYIRFERWLRGCWIEAQAYQAVTPEELKRKHKDWLIHPIKTFTDKVTRAHKLTPLFEQHRIHFRPNQHHLIDRLVSFPHGHDDLFDSLDFAVHGLRTRVRRKTRDKEPGLM